MGILNFLKNTFVSNNEEAFYYDIVKASRNELINKGQQYWWSLKPSDIDVFKEKVLTLSDKQKVAFINIACYKIHEYNKGTRNYDHQSQECAYSAIAEAYIQHLLKTKLMLDDEDIESIINTFITYNKYNHGLQILHWPINMLVNHIEKQVKDRGVSVQLKQTLQTLLSKIKQQAQSYQEKDKLKIVEKINAILFKNDDTNIGIKPTYFLGEDEFGIYANDCIKKMNDADQQNWFKLMLHAQKASGAKPSNKFLDDIKVLFKEYGVDKFKLQVNDWILFLIAMKEKVTSHISGSYNYDVVEFISSPNTDIIKGFVWSCVHFHDKNTLFNIAKLAERSYRKIPGKGPAAASIGNACLYVLANSKGLDGVGHLSRLKLRIKQSSTQNLIEKYLQDAATSQGVSIHEIEDMAVDDNGLLNGKKVFEFDGYKAELIITGVGKTALNWYKPDGSPQKAIPSVVKEKHAVKLKKIKDTIKQIELTVGAQRDRLDRMFKSNRSIIGTSFNEFYFSHGLMSYLAHNIIWTIERAGKKEAAFYLNEKWCNNKGELIEVIIDESTTFSLWHPVFYSVGEIKQWRDFMMEHKIVQPLKQAYREVYLLTDAEVNTITYSNRMAAHILKQHQFNSLAKTRGWKYSLMGCFDNGMDSDFASTELKEYNLRAEFWINEINAEEAYNDTGIWLYIATDQIRFTDTTTNTVKQLIEIPPIVLSEIMRDVDLFVGVASVGNDPNWQDGGGLRGYNNYWQAYSFGDLNEVAKTRKTILEGLLPRLKIGKVSTIKDKFLVVKGSLRTYKIHLGSTNILMEPNDQYLCIVADRGKKDTTENIFLPFEGDNGLSIILSKAMLLSEDEKITDSTITSQIKRR
jgi:Domain of unknown function (DUF4132)